MGADIVVTAVSQTEAVNRTEHPLIIIMFALFLSINNVLLFGFCQWEPIHVYNHFRPLEL